MFNKKNPEKQTIKMSNTLMGKIYIVIQKSRAGLLKLENTDCKGCLVFRDPSVTKLSLRYNKRT